MKRAKHIDNVDRKTLTVRMFAPTYFALAKIAQEENRSINGQIMKFVLDGMSRYLGEKGMAETLAEYPNSRASQIVPTEDEP